MYEAKQQGRDRVAWPCRAAVPRAVDAAAATRRRGHAPGGGGPRSLRSTVGRPVLCFAVAHDAGRARPDADGAAAAARAGRRPRPVADPAAARPAPGLMDRAGIDLWLVVGREYNEDPVLATLLPATWLSARRRTILAPAPQRRRRHAGRGLPLPGRPVPAGLVARGGAGPAGGASRSGRRCAASSSRPTRARIGIDVSAVLRAGRRAVAHRAPAARPRRSGPTPTASCRPRSSRSAGWRPGCPRRSRRCTRSTGWRTR